MDAGGAVAELKIAGQMTKPRPYKADEREGQSGRDQEPA